MTFAGQGHFRLGYHLFHAKATQLVTQGVTGWVRQGCSFVRQTFGGVFGEDSGVLAN
jgi:hypothetical protein